MKKETISFNDTGNFSKKFLSFINKDSKEEHFPDEKNIIKAIDKVDFSNSKRRTLHSEITSQYNSIEISNKLSENIDSILSDNTFTITTGHQLNVCTGPLYVIYKIISAIKLAENLSKKYPNYNFVPVYWMASEDHDFDEIKSFHSLGRTHVWDIKTSGPVGDINPKSFAKILQKESSIPSFFLEAYNSSDSLSEAVIKYMNFLFGERGLIVIDPNSKLLKKSFVQIIEDDIINNSIYNIEKTSEIKSDVLVRKINFFYQEKNFRERIEKENEYKILSTSKSFDESTMKKLIHSSPENFSPNVISRCLFQQSILPNISYVGGPAEIVYWLSFKKFFKSYDINYPVLIPRDFCLILSEKVQKIIEKYNLNSGDLFKSRHVLESKSIGAFEDETKNFSNEIQKIKDAVESLSSKFGDIDSTMKPHVLATGKKIEKTVSQVERRYVNALKKNNSDAISHIKYLIDNLKPNNSIQERKENMISFYDSSFIDDLYKDLDPLDLNFKILKM